MQSISQYISAAVEVASDATIAHAQGLLAQDGRTHVLVVTDAGRPIGLLADDAVAGAPDRHALVKSLIRAEPLLVDAGADALEAARQAALWPGAAADGFLVCRGGVCIGAASLAGVLEALAAERAGSDDPAARRSAKRDFLALVDRELAGPLDGLMAMAELLDRQPLTTDAHAHVRSIRQSGDAIKRALSNAIDLTSAELGVLEMHLEPVVLRDLLDDIQAQWAPRTAESGVSLLVSFDGDPDAAGLTDGRRLRQVFDSLIKVSMRFTRQGSVEVAMKVTGEGDQLRVEGRVRDTSPGLPPHVLARVFEQEHYAEGEGGLSLPLARELMLGLNGCIRAESNVGAGVCVVFDFICEAAVAAQAEAQPVASGSAHVLVVDDNGTNRMVAEALCEMFECTSESAEDGVEAVEIARSGRFDVILMDIKMPRMDGMAATRAIRALEGAASRTPIIALTANVDPEDARAYLASGMCAVVEKPIKPERLLQAINEALASGRQQQSAAA